MFSSQPELLFLRENLHKELITNTLFEVNEGISSRIPGGIPGSIFKGLPEGFHEGIVTKKPEGIPERISNEAFFFFNEAILREIPTRCLGYP